MYLASQLFALFTIGYPSLHKFYESKGYPRSYERLSTTRLGWCVEILLRELSQLATILNTLNAYYYYCYKVLRISEKVSSPPHTLRRLRSIQ